MSFHLFGSFNFFQQSFLVFKVEYKFGTSFLKFIPKHIILFSAIVNEIVFLILFWIVYCKCRKYNWFLYIDLVSCDLAALIY